MMRSIAFVALLLPLPALAEVGAAERAQIIELAEAFSDGMGRANGIEVSIRYTHPRFAEVVADQFGIATTDELFNRMRNGYAHSTSQIEMISHDMQSDLARFGQTGYWSWGIVPYASQARWIETQLEMPPNCNALFVFGRAGDWYMMALDGRSEDLLLIALPELTVVKDPAPQCAVGTS